MILETERLNIIALSPEQFGVLLSDECKLHLQLGLNPSDEYMSEYLWNAMNYLYKKVLNDPDEYLWLTNWQIILKSENKAIGSADFKNTPDKHRSVEIGYGIHHKYRNRGYMTEAVIAMCNWALNQQEVKYIIAETEKDNLASQKVLQKAGMILYNETDSCFLWNLRKE